MKYASLIFIMYFLASCTSSKLKETINTSEYSKEIYSVDTEARKQGLYVELTLSGDTISTANYVDDKLEGQRKVFSVDGKLKTIENYSKGNFEGPIVTFFGNGNLQTKGNYTNNILDTDFYSYYESGELREKVTIRDNEENGPFEEYYKTGKVHWKGEFINGPNEVGILLEYDEEGVLIKKMECGLYHEEYICQTIWHIDKGDVPLKIQYEN